LGKGDGKNSGVGKGGEKRKKRREQSGKNPDLTKTKTVGKLESCAQEKGLPMRRSVLGNAGEKA